MEIQHHNNETKGFFMATSENKEAGKITYSWAGKERIIIDHTEVYPEFKGKKVGFQMVMSAVEYARKNNVKIIPLCPFVKSVFEKTVEIRDVL